MNIDPIQNFTFNLENERGEIIVKGEIRGESEVPFLDDLKLKAVVALLNSVDKQNFIESENTRIFDTYLKEIEDTIGEIKKHNRFQGEIKSPNL